MKVLRYSFPLGQGVYSLQMPKAARIVDAVWQEKREMFSIYAEVISKDEIDPVFHEEREEAEIITERRFQAFPTGVETYGKHIRSVLMPDGYHVFHVYEVSA